MDKILKSVYLKLDSNMQSLTKNATAQFLVKLIYAAESGLSQKDLISRYKEAIRNQYIDEKDIITTLDDLVTNENIKYRNGYYYLSTSRRKKIDASYQESQRRNIEIVETFFHPCFSTVEIILEWLSDSMIFFFETYSNEWMSNICYDKSGKAIINSKESILSTISRRTSNNKRLDKRDLKELSNKFIDFISTKNPVVDTYLWEYGTSAFAAKLITAANGADKLSIETFKKCKCVLDTNILMNIGLESSDYYSALKSVEDVFSKLNVEVGVFHITRDEYVYTVGQKRDKILELLSKGYSIDVIRELPDQYSQTAIKRSCTNETDFERFFDQLLDVPKFLDEMLPINLYDHDKDLENTITKAQEDPQKQSELNNIYKNIIGRDKNQHSLIHDIGMIAGADYLRMTGKAFILSQEISVNGYSKQRPSVSDLPLSMKLETLINVLAINSGGVDVNTSDYIPLFASMIRSGIHSHKDTFKIEDLSLMLEREEQIAQLPSMEVIKIAKDINRRRLLGEPEDKIGLELSRQVQGAKLKIADDLRDTQRALTLEKDEKNRETKRANTSTSALRETIASNVDGEYEEIISIEKRKFYLGVPALMLIICGFLYWVYYANVDSVNVFWSIIIALLVSIVTSALFLFFKACPKIRMLNKNRESWVRDETEKRLHEKLKK